MVRDNVRRRMGFSFCNVQIKDSRFTNNNFTEGRISSGGITLFWSNARVINSTFTGNQGHTLVVMRQSQATTVGCQFLDNAVKSKGAAVNVSDQSEYHDQGSSFADNVAGEGGKILNKKKTFLETFQNGKLLFNLPQSLKKISASKIITLMAHHMGDGLYPLQGMG